MKIILARGLLFASSRGTRRVYTPCFVRNGSEWRPLWGGSPASGEPVGWLTVEFVEGDVCRAGFTPDPGARGASASYAIHLALLGGGVSSRVIAGENKSATLGHGFVVLGVASGSLAPDPKIQAFTGTVMLPRSELSGLTRVQLRHGSRGATN